MATAKERSQYSFPRQFLALQGDPLLGLEAVSPEKPWATISFLLEHVFAFFLVTHGLHLSGSAVPARGIRPPHMHQPAQSEGADGMESV